MAAHDDELLPSAVERHIARSRIDDRPAGAIPASSLQRERDVVSYLRGSLMPRYMERLRDIHVQMRRHLEELRRLRDELPPEEFRAVLESWDFSETNELIRRHNAWYPIERVTLAAEGFRSRISDLLNASERDFLALTDVELVPLDGGEPVRRPFVVVGRRHIVYVTPVDEG